MSVASEHVQTVGVQVGFDILCEKQKKSERETLDTYFRETLNNNFQRDVFVSHEMYEIYLQQEKH